MLPMSLLGSNHAPFEVWHRGTWLPSAPSKLRFELSVSMSTPEVLPRPTIEGLDVSAW